MNDAASNNLGWGSMKWLPQNKSSASASCYLIGVDLSFLAESRRHILGLDLLLGQMVLVLVEKMLVLHLWRVKHKGEGWETWECGASSLRVSRITWLDLTKDFGPMSNCDWGGGAMWPLWPLKSGLVRWRPIVGEYLSWMTPGPVPIPLPMVWNQRC